MVINHSLHTYKSSFSYLLLYMLQNNGRSLYTSQQSSSNILHDLSGVANSIIGRGTFPYIPVHRDHQAVDFKRN